MPPITHDKGKGLVAPNNIDIPVEDELSLGSSLSLNLSQTKNTRESTRTRSRKRPSPHPAFSDSISGASHRARREAGRRQYRFWLSLGELASVAYKHVATSAARASCFWYSANVLHTVGGLNKETR